MPTSLDLELERMITAFNTNEQIEVAVRRQQKRDEALIRLADDVRAQRSQLALELREYLYRSVSRSRPPTRPLTARRDGHAPLVPGSQMFSRWASVGSDY